MAQVLPSNAAAKEGQELRKLENIDEEAAISVSPALPQEDAMEAGGALDSTIDDMEDAIARVHEVIDEHQGAAWQGVLGHVVTQLVRNSVVAAELWIRSHPNQEGEMELHRAAGGLFIHPSFSPPDQELLDTIKLQPPPNAPDTGLAGIHWSQGADQGEGGMDASRHGVDGSRHGMDKNRLSRDHGTDGSPGRQHHRPSRDRPSHDSTGRRSSRERMAGLAHRLRRPSSEHDWHWQRLDLLVDNPEMIFDDYARVVARTFGLVHLLKFRSKTDDFGGVLLMYTDKQAMEDGQALAHESARSFSHTIARLVSSTCVMTPFQLPLASVLGVFKRGVEEASHVLLWVVSGGQYRIVAHHVNETRRFPTWVAPTLRFASPFLPLPSVCSARLTSPL